MEQSQNSPCWGIFIEGSVQGVGYRRFAQLAAQARQLPGWTRNLRDGRVEVRVRASREQLEDFLSELRHGPASGHVRGIEVRQVPQEHWTEFNIIETPA